MQGALPVMIIAISPIIIASFPVSCLFIKHLPAALTVIVGVPHSNKPIKYFVTKQSPKPGMQFEHRSTE